MKNDEQMLSTLDKAAISYQIVLTKADKINNSEVSRKIINIRSILERRPAAHPQILLTSARTGYGIEDIRKELASIIS